MHSHTHSISARHTRMARQVRHSVSSIPAALLLQLASLLAFAFAFTFALLVAAAAAA
jgi:hypothetical protein